ncbi:MAG: Tex family protein [Burkholderiales bacterium]|nr:Tex family protein [Burkholderiales bacterium]
MPAADPRLAEHRVLNSLAQELAVPRRQVEAATALLDEGATVPFIARYRKEVTGGLDDTQLRLLAERLVYLRELEERRAAILASIDEQGKLTAELAQAIDTAQTKQRLEDLYLPYKPRRRTRAQIARESGLEPLADALLADHDLDPVAAAAAYVRAPDPAGEGGVADTKAALDGARDIVSERFAERADVLDALRELLWTQGWIHCRVVEEKRGEAVKFSDYFDHGEPLAAIPSHRALALFRGRQLGLLAVRLGLEPARDELLPHPAMVRLASIVGLGAALGGPRPAHAWLAEACRWTWRVKLLPHFESELFGRVRDAAEGEAIRVFGDNLKDLLLAAPAGPRAVLGLDPGLRTGVKVAVVDITGKLVETATVFPHEPRRDWDGSIAALALICARHRVELVAIGNGTASRETDRLTAELQRRHPELGLRKVVVSEAGASVYSASELAAREFPELDVSLRGAVSIARRLQDPLAELVKIDPKAIGVGPSAALLARVSGLSSLVAQRVVAFRDAHGSFADRLALRQVPYFGDKAFEQAAGFLRIFSGANPLDASAVHPEAYGVVERILARVSGSAKALIGNRDLLRRLQPGEFVDERFGEPTVRDILVELEKPGRDPRGEFVAAEFREGVEKLSDLEPGMQLQGVVTNVAAFGAFIDIGVHQDGLVHVSELSDRFVKDPREVVRAGQVVKVRVVEVDPVRKRIALSMKTPRPGDDAARADARTGAAPRAGAGPAGGRGAPGGPDSRRGAPDAPRGAPAARRGAPAGAGPRQPAPGNSALADAFLKAGKGR